MKGNTDVGGSGGTYANSGGSVSYHGKTGRKFSFDGMQIQNVQGAGNTSYMMNLDIYNALNGSAILTINNTYGPNWLQPLRILDARLVQVSGSVDF